MTKLFCTEKKHFEEDLEVPEGPLLTTDLGLPYAAIHAEETELRLSVQSSSIPTPSKDGPGGGTDSGVLKEIVTLPPNLILRSGLGGDGVTTATRSSLCKSKKKSVEANKKYYTSLV